MNAEETEARRLAQFAVSFVREHAAWVMSFYKNGLRTDHTLDELLLACDAVLNGDLTVQDVVKSGSNAGPEIVSAACGMVCWIAKGGYDGAIRYFSAFGSAYFRLANQASGSKLEEHKRLRKIWALACSDKLDSPYPVHNGYAVKDQLKALGARFNSSDKAWLVPAARAREAIAICDEAGI